MADAENIDTPAKSKKRRSDPSKWKKNAIKVSKAKGLTNILLHNIEFMIFKLLHFYIKPSKQLWGFAGFALFLF